MDTEYDKNSKINKTLKMIHLTTRQEEALAGSFWILLTISFIVILTLMCRTPQDDCQKQHNFPVGDDTEHTWVGGNGESFEE